MSSSARFSDFISRIREDKKTVAELKTELENLSSHYDEFKQYFYKAGCSSEKLVDKFRSVSHDIGVLRKKTGQLAAKATEKLQIAFIGHTSSGKTTLINALLGQVILPVHCSDTTFCSVAISGTDEKEWSATVQGTDQKLEEESLQQILHQFSANHEDFMNKYKLTAASVIELKWPSQECKALADHVIMYDTPGIGESDGVDDAVAKLLRSVDVAVAVMDIHSPGLKSVQDVVKGANCNYTLAAFTKWDTYTKRSKAGEQVKVVDDEEVKRIKTRKFLNAVDDRGEAFFVDAKSHVDAIDGSEILEGASNFRDFESHMVTQANCKLKSERLHEDLLSVITESKKVAHSLDGVIKMKQKQQKDRIIKELNQVEALDRKLGEALGKAKEELRQSLENVEIEKVTNRIDEYLKIGLSDEEIVKKCQQELNMIHEESFANDTSNIIKCAKDIDLTVDEDSFKISTPTPWKPDDFKINDSYEYKWYTDPHYWLTNPLTWGACAGTVAEVAVAALFPPVLPAACLVSLIGIGAGVNYHGGLKTILPSSPHRRESLEKHVRSMFSSLQEDRYRDAVTSCLKDVTELSKGKSSRVLRSIRNELEKLDDPNHPLNKSKKQVRQVLNSLSLLESTKV